MPTHHGICQNKSKNQVIIENKNIANCDWSCFAHMHIDNIRAYCRSIRDPNVERLSTHALLYIYTLITHEYHLHTYDCHHLYRAVATVCLFESRARFQSQSVSASERIQSTVPHSHTRLRAYDFVWISSYSIQLLSVTEFERSWIFRFVHLFWL